MANFKVVSFGPFLVLFAIIFWLFNGGCPFGGSLPGDPALLCHFLNEYCLLLKKKRKTFFTNNWKYLMNQWLNFGLPLDYGLVKRIDGPNHDLGAYRNRKIEKNGLGPRACHLYYLHAMILGFLQISWDAQWINKWNFTSYYFWPFKEVERFKSWTHKSLKAYLTFFTNIWKSRMNGWLEYCLQAVFGLLKIMNDSNFYFHTLRRKKRR